MIDRGGRTQRFAAVLVGATLVLAVGGCSAASPSATASGGSSQPSPTGFTPTLVPVVRSISGTATVATTGVPVAGVRIRAHDPFAEPPSPEVTAVTDERGAYTLTFATVPGGNPPTLFLTLELPPGFVFVAMTKTDFPFPGALPTQRMLPLDDLGDGPIDITLGPGHVIEGRITNGLSGAPLEGTFVSALKLNSILIYGGMGDAFEVEAQATSDATGKYSLTVLSGSYVIHAAGPEGYSQQRFWSEDATVFQATPLSVDRAIAGLNIALVPVSAIVGEVRSGPTQFADALAGVQVVAYLAGDAACCRIGGVGVTGEQGTFLIYLPQGLYRIAFEPPAGSPYAEEWWSEAAGFATAIDVTVGSEAIQLEAELAPVSP